MYAKIIVPLDGSPTAEGILPYVRAVAKASHASVELLQAIPPELLDALSDPGHRRYADDVEADIKCRSRSYLGSVAASLPDPAAVECVVRVGEPTDVIVDDAKPGTVVLMATHGRSGARRWLLGSVADGVMRQVRTHLLLVRTDELKVGKEAALKSIVVPLDGSALAEQVLPSVVALANSMRLEVILIRVYSVPNAVYGSDEYIPNMWQFIERVKAETKVYLEKIADGLKQQGIERVSILALEGDAATEIIDYARKTPDNLIAMSTHGRSGVRRLFGSITDRVVRHSWDPVLIIPPALALMKKSAEKLAKTKKVSAAA
jgi:nucleotide-binding universal stress UspA family protein